MIYLYDIFWQKRRYFFELFDDILPYCVISGKFGKKEKTVAPGFEPGSPIWLSSSLPTELSALVEKRGKLIVYFEMTLRLASNFFLVIQYDINHFEKFNKL